MNNKQLKVGDFITFLDISDKNPKRIVDIIDDILYTENNKCLISQCRLWAPQVNKLCWFTNNKELNIGYLGEFLTINDDGCFFDITQSSWLYCEPFLNSKPSWFKD